MRLQCMHSKAVCRAIGMWWTVVPKLPDSGGARVGKEAYVAMSARVQRALNALYDEAEARECAEEDWEEDRCGFEDLDQCVLELFFRPRLRCCSFIDVCSCVQACPCPCPPCPSGSTFTTRFSSSRTCGWILWTSRTTSRRVRGVNCPPAFCPSARG